MKIATHILLRLNGKMVMNAENAATINTSRGRNHFQDDVQNANMMRAQPQVQCLIKSNFQF